MALCLFAPCTKFQFTTNVNGANSTKPLLAEVISREQYLNALEIIDNYHRQKLNVETKVEVNKSIFKANRGDFVFCKYVRDANKKCLTKNKKYEIIDFYYNQTEFYLIDDNGKRKRYSCDDIQFSAV